MKGATIVDTGPLVAFLRHSEQHHAWAVAALKQIRPPLVTCEAVLAEASFLLQRGEGSADDLLELVHRQVVTVRFSITPELSRVRELMTQYRNLPMSFADACLVRMTELYPDHRLLTLDAHFRVYRQFGRKSIPVLMPASE